VKVVEQLQALRALCLYFNEKFPARCKITLTDRNNQFRRYHMYWVLAPMTPAVQTQLVEPAFKDIDFAEVTYEYPPDNPEYLTCRMESAPVTELLARYLGASGRSPMSRRTGDYMGFLIAHLIRMEALRLHYMEFPLSGRHDVQQKGDVALCVRLCSNVIRADNHPAYDPVVKELRKLLTAWDSKKKRC